MKTKEKTDLVPIITVAECFPPPQKQQNSKPKKQKQKEEDSWLLTDVHQLLETGAAVNFEDVCGSSEGIQGRNIAVQFSRQFRTDSKVMTDCIEKQKALEKAWGWHTLDWQFTVFWGGGKITTSGSCWNEFWLMGLMRRWRWQMGARWEDNQRQSAEHALSEKVSSNGGSKKQNLYMARADSPPRPESAVSCSLSGVTWLNDINTAALVSTGEDAQSNSIVIYVEIQIKLEELSPPILTN